MQFSTTALLVSSITTFAPANAYYECKFDLKLPFMDDFHESFNTNLRLESSISKTASKFCKNIKKSCCTDAQFYKLNEKLKDDNTKLNLQVSLNEKELAAAVAKLEKNNEQYSKCLGENDLFTELQTLIEKRIKESKNYVKAYRKCEQTVLDHIAGLNCLVCDAENSKYYSAESKFGATLNENVKTEINNNCKDLFSTYSIIMGGEAKDDIFKKDNIAKAVLGHGNSNSHNTYYLPQLGKRSGYYSGEFIKDMQTDLDEITERLKVGVAYVSKVSSLTNTTECKKLREDLSSVAMIKTSIKEYIQHYKIVWDNENQNGDYQPLHFVSNSSDFSSKDFSETGYESIESGSQSGFSHTVAAVVRTSDGNNNNCNVVSVVVLNLVTIAFSLL
eukprot:Pgem_evm1s3211